jgi:hypothetical protein
MDILSASLVITPIAFFSIILTGIIVYLGICTTFFFITKKQFNKGVNID